MSNTGTTMYHAYIMYTVTSIHILYVVLTMVNRPDVTEETRSFPALAVMTVLCAPDTAGP